MKAIVGSHIDGSVIGAVGWRHDPVGWQVLQGGSAERDMALLSEYVCGQCQTGNCPSCEASAAPMYAHVASPMHERERTLSTHHWGDQRGIVRGLRVDHDGVVYVGNNDRNIAENSGLLVARRCYNSHLPIGGLNAAAKKWYLRVRRTWVHYPSICLRWESMVCLSLDFGCLGSVET